MQEIINKYLKIEYMADDEFCGKLETGEKIIYEYDLKELLQEIKTDTHNNIMKYWKDEHLTLEQVKVIKDILLIIK